MIGGSIAGLLAARILSKYFDSVIIVERDRVFSARAQRKSTPQSAHAHLLLNGGAEVVAKLFPGIFQDLTSTGATSLDLMRDLHWFHHGIECPRVAGSISIYSQTRSFFEAHVRERVLSIENVEMRSDCKVAGLVLDPDGRRVMGVQLARDAVILQADLVVDASGRSSRMTKWLLELGYREPPVSSVHIDLAYASRLYRPPQKQLDWRALAVYPDSPRQKRGVVVLPVEGDRWIVTLFGYHGDHPSHRAEGYLEFAKNLLRSSYYDVLKQATALSEPQHFRIPAQKWCRFEKSRAIPAGWIAVGDAVCSLDPVFGQGMSVAAKQSRVLEACLQQFGPKAVHDTRFQRRFLEQSAAVIAVPWQLTSYEAFRFKDTHGERPRALRFMNWYSDHLASLTGTSSSVYRTFLEVAHLMRSPLALFRPGILWRVLTRSLRSISRS